MKINIRKYIFNLGIKVKLLGGLIILIIVSYLLYNFLLAPLFAQQKILRLSLLSQEKLLESRMAGVTNINNLKEELNKTKKALEDIESKFLTEEELPVFFAKLRGWAVENYVKILNLKVGEKQPLSIDFEIKDFKYEELPVNISLKGDYLNIILFLAQLRQEPVIFSISKMSMSIHQDRSLEPKSESVESIRTDLQLTLYLVYE